MNCLTFNEFDQFGNDRQWIMEQMSPEDKIRLMCEGIKEIDFLDLYQKQ
jgi:hypothetical protein